MLHKAKKIYRNYTILPYATSLVTLQTLYTRQEKQQKYFQLTNQQFSINTAKYETCALYISQLANVVYSGLNLPIICPYYTMV